jgi:hypothetical protein
MPLIKDISDCLVKAKFYTKLNIIATFNKLRTAPGHKHFMAFRMRYGQYKLLMTPFGPCNSPASFQHHIIDILFLFLSRFYTAYLDNILVYSMTLIEH